MVETCLKHVLHSAGRGLLQTLFMCACIAFPYSYLNNKASVRRYRLRRLTLFFCLWSPRCGRSGPRETRRGIGTKGLLRFPLCSASRPSTPAPAPTTSAQTAPRSRRSGSGPWGMQPRSPPRQHRGMALTPQSYSRSTTELQ